MTPSHVEHLVPCPVWSVRRNLDQKLRRCEIALVHHLKDDLRDVVELTRTVRLRTAKTNRLVPVVVDRSPLPEEMLELFAELCLSGASGGDVGIVVRREKHIQLRERTALDSIKMLGVEEIEPHEHHHVVGRLRRAAAQTFQTRNFLF